MVQSVCQLIILYILFMLCARVIYVTNYYNFYSRRALEKLHTTAYNVPATCAWYKDDEVYDLLLSLFVCNITLINS